MIPINSRRKNDFHDWSWGVLLFKLITKLTRRKLFGAVGDIAYEFNSPILILSKENHEIAINPY